MSEHSHDHVHEHVHDDAVFEGTVAWEGITVPAAPSSNSTVAWFHCFSGIAGDMALGALIDAGADVDEIILDGKRATGVRMNSGETLNADIVVFGGGVIPTDDVTQLQDSGVAHVFTPGTPIGNVVEWVRANVGVTSVR